MENVKIERIDNIIKIIANDSYKITNSKNDYYSDFIFLPSNYNLEDNPQGIRAVGYGIWGQFLEEEIPQNKVEELTAKIKTLEDEKAELKDKLLEVEKEHGDYLLDNDLRITMLELGLD